MMSPEMEKLRAEFIKKDKHASGREGERFASESLHKLDIPFEPVEQGISTLSKELKAQGGKRPDFIIATDLDKSVILIDAKYHSTDNGKLFKLTKTEISQYDNLKTFIEKEFPGPEVFIFFMVFPKEFTGKCFALVDLQSFKTATSCTLANQDAKEVSIEQKLLSSDTGKKWTK